MLLPLKKIANLLCRVTPKATCITRIRAHLRIRAWLVLLMFVAQALHHVIIDELKKISCNIHWVSLEKKLNIGISPNKTPTSASVSYSKMLLKLKLLHSVEHLQIHYKIRLSFLRFFIYLAKVTLAKCVASSVGDAMT